MSPFCYTLFGMINKHNSSATSAAVFPVAVNAILQNGLL
jgi:hypothetical protein